MAQFTKGNTHGKGRIKGSTNLATAEIKNAFQKLLTDNLPNLQKDILELEPKDRIKLMVDLLAYFAPKLKSIDVVENSTHAFGIEQDLAERIYNLSDESLNKLYNE